MNKTEHIVITGASHGIGAAVATAWASAFKGSRLSLLSRNEANLRCIANICNDLGAHAASYPCDLTDATQVQATCNTLLKYAGPPTALFNNAGAFRPGGLTDTSFERFDEMIAVNLTSAFQVTSSLLPAMIKDGSGHVFFMGSVASVKGYPGGLAYCAAKHGLLGLARSIREETRGKGIRVTSLLAGATWTPSWEGTDLPEDRFMPAEDVADALIAAYQMSDRTVVEELLLRPQLGDL